MKCADILLKYNLEDLVISHYGIIKDNEALLNRFWEFVEEYEPVVADIIAQENSNLGFRNWKTIGMV